jgi:hypothetical protein
VERLGRWRQSVRGKAGLSEQRKPYASRGIPDVSYDADPNTGFAVYDSVTYQRQSGWFQVGGTSAGTPQSAATIAVADQLRAASSRPRLTGASFAADTAIHALQGTSALADITNGSNGSCGSVCTAGPGYDFHEKAIPRQGQRGGRLSRCRRLCLTSIRTLHGP